MKEMTITAISQSMRAMALPLSRAQVSDLSLNAAAERAHGLVGYAAVATFGGGVGTPVALLVRPQVQVQGTSVPNGKPSVIGTDPVGGVRGIPPRGWPV